MQKSLTIGHLAKAADVNIETVRYYQRIALLTEPEKPIEGYRIYPQAYISRIRFIKRAQQLGFKLSEIAELLQLGDGQCDDVRSRAEDKLTQVERQINDLKNLRNTLNRLISTCHQQGDSGHCPIIETLTDMPDTHPKNRV
jgi:MerR family transcriptional regulator, mercuric resistance operon regulatory protein